MLTAAQHQLLVVSQRVGDLQGEVETRLKTVKALRRSREEIDAHVEAMRNELAKAEMEQADIHADQMQEESSLREVAHDYAKTQLLQRRFRNALREGQGFNRSLVWLVEMDSNEDREEDGGVAAEEGGGAPLVKIADECTLALPSTQRTFVVDGVAEIVVSKSGALLGAAINDSSSDDEDDEEGEVRRGSGSSSVGGQFTSTMRATVEEACRGYNLHFIGLEEGSAAPTSPQHQSPSSTHHHHVDGRSMLNSNEVRSTMGEGGDRFRHHQQGGGVNGASSSSSSQPPTLSAQTLMFGSGDLQEPGSGIAKQFAATFFDSMDTLDVTHFNLRATFVEVAPEGLYDLLDVEDDRHSQPRGIPLPVGRFPLAQSSSNGQQRDSRFHVSTLPADLEVSSLQIHSEKEYTSMLECALSNRLHRLQERHNAEIGSATTPRNAATLVALFGGHLVLTLYLETFNSRGNYRRSCVVFAGVASGSVPPQQELLPSLNHRHPAASPISSEQEWVSRGHGAVTDCISMAAASSVQIAAEICRFSESNNSGSDGVPSNDTFDGCMHILDTSDGRSVNTSNPAQAISRSLAKLELPHQRNIRVVAILREVFGGNSRGVLCCAVRRLVETGNGGLGQELASTDNLLSFAHHFKSSANEAVPYDLPPELQRLTEAMSQQTTHHHRGSHNTSFTKESVLSTGRSNKDLVNNNSANLGGRRLSGTSKTMPSTYVTSSQVQHHNEPAAPSHRGPKVAPLPSQQHTNGLTMSRTSSSSMMSEYRHGDNYTAIGSGSGGGGGNNNNYHHQPANVSTVAPTSSSSYPLPSSTSAPPPPPPTTRRFVAGMPLSAVMGGNATASGRASVTSSLNTSQHPDEDRPPVDDRSSSFLYHDHYDP